MINPAFKNARILIVDDKEANIDVLAGFLEIQGCLNIRFTTDPRQVAALCASFNPDLILLDLMMPYLSGYDVMEQIKGMAADNTYLPILVLTADITLDAKLKALACGAKDFLAKPFDLVEVGLRINNLLFARFLHLQLQDQNHLLEDKVMERTAELEQVNVALTAALDKAEESDRLKAAFLRNISHEIRTPLNGILGISSIFKDHKVEDLDKEEYYSYLKSSSNRLIKTVTDIMDISLLVSGNMTAEQRLFTPGELLMEVYQEFRDSFETKNVAFILDMQHSGDAGQLEGYPELLRKAVMHLVDNALKFTSKGSVTIGFEHKGQELEFFIRDTGIGIAEPALEFIFDYFVQENGTHNRLYEGSGLGLTIAQKCIEFMGGKISLQSVKGEGSVFYISIPFKSVC
ncbi:MAG: response regulator [Bacteroidales bacterium]